jgi:hypothetical protein
MSEIVRFRDPQNESDRRHGRNCKASRTKTAKGQAATFCNVFGVVAHRNVVADPGDRSVKMAEAPGEAVG